MSSIPQLVDAELGLQERVATLTLNRDDVRNALTGTALIDDIETTIRWINRTPEVSALIVTGAGRAFSAGGNIKDMQQRSGDFGGDVHRVQQNYREGIQRIPLTMHQAEVLLIAAINGPAIGAGFDLACMCDIRSASNSAVMGETFVNLGIIPGDGGAWFLQRLIGYQRAAELTFSGRVIDAQEALAMSILLAVETPEALMPKARQLAATFAAKPPQALRYTKRLMKLARRQELPDFLDSCALFQGICHNTDDQLEAVNAFIEKRKPEFKGK